MSLSSYLLSFACSPSPSQQQHPSQTSHCCSRSSKVVSNATYCLADGIGLSGQINTLASEIPNQCSCSRGRIQISTARYWHGKTFPTLCCLNLPVTSIATSHCFVVGGLEFKAKDNVAASKTCAEGDPQVLIECRNVYKSFGEKQILKGASFKIRHGEAVGIIGPSGTGKSTILRIMAGLLIPDKGEVFVCGKKRKGLISDEELPGLHIGLVFQSAALFDSLTVRENVGFMLDEHFNLSNEKVSELVTESLAAVGLKGVEDRLPAELSGGMKKRVALARAIISDNLQDTGEPEVVMYDEPTAGLDPIASTVVEDLIRSVHIKGHDARGKPGKISSYVVVTHQHSTIRRAVDRILFLHDGEIVWEGTTAEFDTTTNLIVRQFAEGSLHGPIRY